MTARPTPANRHHWWVYDADADLLHALPATAVDPDNEDQVDRFRDDGVTTRAVCTKEGTWWWPGMASRMALPRCAGCCDQLGIPHGTGTPGNDPRVMLSPGTLPEKIVDYYGEDLALKINKRSEA